MNETRGDFLLRSSRETYSLLKEKFTVAEILLIGCYLVTLAGIKHLGSKELAAAFSSSMILDAPDEINDEIDKCGA